jgi:hypothetical protein
MGSVCLYAGLCEQLTERFIAFYWKIDRPPCNTCPRYCEGIFDSENKLPPKRVKCWDPKGWLDWLEDLF